MKSESILEAAVRKEVLAWSANIPALRLHANPRGKGWVGKKVGDTKSGIVLHNGRPIDFGLNPGNKGSSDLIGWFTYRGIGVFVSFELKSPTGKPTEEQLNWIEQVNNAGGIAGVVRSGSDAVKLLNEWMDKHE